MSGLLSTVDASSWPEGPATLRLYAADSLNNTSYASIKIDVSSVIFQGENPLLDQTMESIAPHSIAKHSDEIWMMSTDGRVHLLGDDGTALQTVAGEMPQLGGREAMVVGQDRIWISTYSGPWAYSMTGFPIAQHSDYLKNATRIVLPPDGNPAVLTRDKVEIFDQSSMTVIDEIALPEEANDIDLGPWGQLYALGKSGEVHVLGLTGETLMSIPAASSITTTTTTTTTTAFKPTRMAVDRFGRIALAGLGGDGERVAVLSPSGEVLMRFGLSGAGEQEIGDIKDLIFDGIDLIIFEGNANKRMNFTPVIPLEAPTQPTVELLYPADGSVVSKGAPIVGTAWNEPGTSWVLEVGQGAAPQTWTQLAQGAGSLAEAGLTFWEASSYSDGQWTLRLTVSDQTSGSISGQSTVTVDNLAPVASITSPTDGTKLSGIVNITGTADDLNFSSYSLVAKISGDEAEIVLGSGATPVVSGILGSWDADSAEPGVYELTLNVADGAGNESSSSLTVSIGDVVYIENLASGIVSNPVGLERLPDGNWLVAVRGNRAVYILSSAGQVLTSISKNYLNQSFFGTTLADAASLPDGTIAVLETNNRVSLYDSNGTSLSGFTLPAGLAGYSTAIVADGQGRLVILDEKGLSYGARSWAHPPGYHVFTTDGTLVYSVTGYGDGPGEFIEPFAVDVDASGNVYVADSDLQRLQIFDGSGNLLDIFDFGDFLPNDANALSVAEDGAVLLAAYDSYGSDQIFMFSPEGVFLCSWGEYGSAAGQIKNPKSVWLGDGIASVGDGSNIALVTYDVSALIPPTPAVNTAGIASVQDGGLLPARFRIFGTAAGGDFTSYRIEAGVGAAPQTWEIVAAGTVPMVEGVLGTIDLSALPSGDVSLRLIADFNGQEVVHQISGILDNSPPTAAIVSPEEYGLLAEGEPIVVDLSDDGPMTVEVLFGRKGQITPRKVLFEGTVSSGTINVLWPPVDFPPGVYSLSVLAEDPAGNRTITEKIVSTGQVRYQGAKKVDYNIRRLMRDGEGFMTVSASNDGLKYFDGQFNETGGFFGDFSDADLFGDQIVVAQRRASSGKFKVYERSGAYVRSFGSTSASDGALSNYTPHFAVDKQDRTIAADYNKLVLFDSTGNYTGDIALSSSAKDLYLDAFGNWYLLQSSLPKVAVMRPDGRTVLSFGEAGQEPWQFSSPLDFAVDESGRVAVRGQPSDGYLSFWSPAGEYIGYIAGPTYAEGCFGRAINMVWGADGNLYMATEDDHVMVFDASNLFAPSVDFSATIAFPANNGWVGGETSVVGSVGGEGTYELTIQPNGGAPVLVASGASPLTDGMLGLLDPTGIPEGPATLLLTVTGSGGSAQASASISIDLQDPSVSIEEPVAFSRITQPISVVGSASDMSLTDWILEIGYEDYYGNQNWETISQGFGNVDGVLGTLNPAQYDSGSYVLRFLASDDALHSASVETPVSFGSTTLLAYSENTLDGNAYDGSLGPVAALPDGSIFILAGAKKHLLRFNQSGQFVEEVPLPPSLGGATPSLMVQTKSGAAFLAMTNNIYIVVFLSANGSEETTITIPYGYGPGRILGVVDLVAGDSRIFILEKNEIEIFDLQGAYINTLGDKGEDPGEFKDLRAGVVDNFGRLLLLDTYSPYSSGRLLFYSANGDYKGERKLFIDGGAPLSPSSTTSAIHVDSNGNIAIIRDLYVHFYRADGEYLGNIGNKGRGPGRLRNVQGISFDESNILWVQNYYDGVGQLHAFSIDVESLNAAMPSAAILSPSTDAFVQSESWITGRVAGLGPLLWTLTASPDADPSNIITIAQGDQPVSSGILGRWDAAGAADGPYTLNLHVVDGVSVETDISKSITLDSAPPVIALDQPMDLEVLANGPLPVSGSVSDDNPDAYRLKYFGTDQKWWTIAAESPYVSGDVASTWYAETLAPAGYRLKLWAIDAAGNLSTVSRDVSIDPVGLKSQIYFAPSTSTTIPAAASRDGRFAMASEDLSEILIYDENLTLQSTLTLPPPDGYSTFNLKHIAFAETGEFVAYSAYRRLVRYSPSEELTGVLDLPSSGTEAPGTVYNMAPLPGGEVVFRSYYYGYKLKHYSFEQGYIGDIAWPTTEAPTLYQVAAYPGGNLMIKGYGSGLYKFMPIDLSGNIIGNIVQVSAAYYDASADGAGSYYIPLNGYHVGKYSPEGTSLWSFGASGENMGRFLEIPSVYAGRAGVWFALEPKNGRLQSFEALDASVDSDPPTSSLDQTLGSQPLAGAVSIDGAVDDPNIASWTLKALPGGNEAGAILIASGIGVWTAGSPVQWDATVVADGGWTLSLNALDTSGNVSTVSVDVTIENPNLPPSVPIVVSPSDSSETTDLLPLLSVQNSTDPNGDALTYDFELYSDAGMTSLVDGASSVIEGQGTTSWQATVQLADNSWHWWRARAADAESVSEWIQGSFFVNTANDAPGAFAASHPQDGAETSSLTPELSVTNSSDVDEDVLTYGFSLYSDSELTNLATSISAVAEGSAGTTSWTVDSTLSDNAWYWWQSTATDEHNAQAQTPTYSFFVNTANDAPTSPAIQSPLAGEEISSTALDLTIVNSMDLDGDLLDYYFELDETSAFDGSAKQTSGALDEGAGTTSWSVSGLNDNTSYYWRAQASDGAAGSGWSQSNFFVNTANDAPTTPTVQNPGDGAWVTTAVPVLSVNPASDPDNDALFYDFEIYSDDALTSLEANGSTDIPTWTAAPPLADNAWHWWQARAVDEHGLAGQWSAASSFFVNNDNIDDPPAITVSEPSTDQIISAGTIITIQWNDADPDSNATVALYWDADATGADGTMIVAGIEEDPDGLGDSYDWDTTGLAAGDYWIYAEICDAGGCATVYGTAKVTVSP